ncbi:AMP-binding protein [Sulfurimonas sp. SAG-AH-194-I05]|nr:AMP-binding protein [Sulfurimonas sp. SAG-AH-194-I05]MDF1874728.1 AMP-binding protein [Sulfurimonas sp. SAG-AH-194-I05]
MLLEYIHTDNSKEIIPLNNSYIKSEEWIILQAKNKLEFIQKFIPAFNAGQKIILFDTKHKQLLEYTKNTDMNTLSGIHKVHSTCQLLFFTSGSTGFPVGAFKTQENMQQEVTVLKSILSQKNFKKVIVTVPFVHIYGVLAGLLLPLAIDDITLVIKEDFLPYEILNESKSGNTLIITTPVFIKALAKLNESPNLSTNLFVCSTGPLAPENVELFQTKYTSNLIQIFGSTETGGIAYKIGNTPNWVPLPHVKIHETHDKLCIYSPFISPYIVRKEIISLKQPFQTEDIVTIKDTTFKLIGRSNKLIKIAGKRISALHIEKILEDIDEVNGAIVTLVYKSKLLKSEHIIITLETKRKITRKMITRKITEYFGVLSIPFQVNYVEKINYSALGKKTIHF